MTNKIILITGANGEIGQHLIKTFNKDSCNKIIAIDLYPQKNNYSVFEYFEGSILDVNLIQHIFKKHSVDIIFHLAAVLSTKAELNPQLAYNINFNGTKLLIDELISSNNENNKITQFFFPSSIAVYNVLNKNRPVLINEQLYCNNPLTIYGKSKRQCEIYGEKLNGKSFDFRCIRFPGIISATSVPTGGTSDYAPEMIHSAAQHTDYQCFVQRTTKLPFVVMPDAVNAIFQIMRANKTNLNQAFYNITSFNPTTNEFYQETKKHYKDFKITYKIDKERLKIVNSWPNDVDDLAAKQDWQWEPRYKLFDAYKNYLVPYINKYYQEKVQ